MNYYVLYCQSVKIEKLYKRFNAIEGIQAFIPKYEKYIGSKDKVILQTLFPGYLFIKTKLNQDEFDTMLVLMNEQKDGVIRELKKEEVSALTQQEIELLQILLNSKGVLVMSKGIKKDGYTIIEEGPLKALEKQIVAVDKKERLAFLSIKFMNRRIKAGLFIR